MCVCVCVCVWADILEVILFLNELESISLYRDNWFQLLQEVEILNGFKYYGHL